MRFWVVFREEQQMRHTYSTCSKISAISICKKNLLINAKYADGKLVEVWWFCLQDGSRESLVYISKDSLSSIVTASLYHHNHIVISKPHVFSIFLHAAATLARVMHSDDFSTTKSRSHATRACIPEFRERQVDNSGAQRVKSLAVSRKCYSE